MIFNDTVNSDQTIQAYKTRVTTRDSASFTENPTFLSTTAKPAGVDAPLDANFLHIDQSVATDLESGGVTIAGFSTTLTETHARRRPMLERMNLQAQCWPTTPTSRT